MGKKADLNNLEKQKITKLLAKKVSTQEISKILNRDHRTIKKFISIGQNSRSRSDKGKIRKISKRDLHSVKRTASRRPLASSRDIFIDAGVPNIPRSTRNTIMKTISRVAKASTRPPLNSTHRHKRLAWAKTYLKMDFNTVIFTDECRATLDGPDGWSSGWVLNGTKPPSRIRRQQGGGGVMFWGGLVGSEVIGPFRVPDGVKMNAASYIDFLKAHLLPWLKMKKPAIRKKLVFMHDNAPSHAANATRGFLEQQGFKDDRLMIWPPCSPDLNPIENFWGILKRDVYKDGRQFSSKDALWDAICAVARSVPATTVTELIKSVDNRLLSVVQKKGSYINK